MALRCAEKEFDRKLKSKTNPLRKSLRKYAVAAMRSKFKKTEIGNKPTL
jgi:hypothetical protein